MIGTLTEKSLHSELKARYARRGDSLEAEIDGYHVDIVRGELLIEIQTANFSSIRDKLTRLTENHPIRLVFPIPQEKWIVRLAPDGVRAIGRRKSPKKGHLFDLFEELVSIPSLIMNPNFSLEVLLIQEEEIRHNDGRGSWRRKGWSIVDRRLLGVLSRQVFKESSDFLAFIPTGISEPFTTGDLAKAIAQPRWLAQKVAYCLRVMEALEVVGMQGNALSYAVNKHWL